MSMVTVRDLDPRVKAKLRERAARQGRSMEAEIRLILADAVALDAEPRSLADIVRDGFARLEVDLDLPDRSDAQQRQVRL